MLKFKAYSKIGQNNKTDWTIYCALSVGDAARWQRRAK